ncbi:MAG: Holliday junction branch migration protein RuvA [Streptococcaceae bacterium]|jgi:Holliday junction DNA helicase RuvA|nr:Holliday junction branch migration protein RuvA [Streptococcaceae bacterium]
MYDYIIGEITKITPQGLTIEAGGVGYLLNVANPYAFSAQLNAVTQVFVEQIIREDAHLLYGFATEDEKAIFQKLISAKGIGPKSALAILAKADLDGLVAAIDGGDVKYLTQFPGIGTKSAQQLILDLSGKFDPQQLPSLASAGNSALDEAMEALQTLGYKTSELTKLKDKLVPADNAEDYIRQALKMMVK